jgi:hypothetical protein
VKPRSWKYRLASHFADFIERLSTVLYRLLIKFISTEKLENFKPIPLCDLYIRLNRPIPQHLVGHATYTIDQASFRFRNDDGSESSATWKYPENSNWELSSSGDQNFRLRFMVQEIGGATGTSSFLLQFSHNNGTWTTATTSTNVVRIRDSANVTDGVTTTDQLGGTGTFDGGQYRETNTSSTVNHSASGHSEHEWSLVLRSAEYTLGDSVKFRLYRTESNAPPSTISVTPEIYGWTLINSIEELNNIRNSVVSGVIRGNFKLARDLDFNDDASYDNPTNNATGVLGGQPLVFLIPKARADVHFQLEIDSVNTFDDDPQIYRSWESQTNWEYYNGSSWVSVPSGGVQTTYSGNEARFVPALTTGTYYRRIRGRVL